MILSGKISFALSIDTVDEVSVKVDGETGGETSGETTKESNISKYIHTKFRQMVNMCRYFFLFPFLS